MVGTISVESLRQCVVKNHALRLTRDFEKCEPCEFVLRFDSSGRVHIGEESGNVCFSEDRAVVVAAFLESGCADTLKERSETLFDGRKSAKESLFEPVELVFMPVVVMEAVNCCSVDAAPLMTTEFGALYPMKRFVCQRCRTVR